MLLVAKSHRLISRLVRSAALVVSLALPFLLIADPAQAVDRPIVFIPGILGSVLSDASGNETYVFASGAINML